MFETLYDTLGVDAKYVAMAAPAVIIVINFFKDVAGIAGKKQLLITSGVISVGFGLNALPDPLGLFFTSLAVWIAAIGLWKSGKKLAHKFGTPSSKEPD